MAFKYVTAEPWIASLAALGHEVAVHWYDRDLPPDRGCLDAADRTRPDLIVWTGMADWAKTPSIGTLLRLREIAPLVHLSGDLSDPPYLPYIAAYQSAQCFTLTVNLDGNDAWPKIGPHDMTLLTPIAPKFYNSSRPLAERPIPFGFAGGYASPSRAAIVNRLIRDCGLVVPPRNEQYGSYQRYADFLLETRLVPNVPFSGSDNSRQVKGRVIEAGLARCCLLEHVESAARFWFTPGRDYAVYTSEDHAVEQAQQLLKSPEIMQELADNLHQRVKAEHSPEIFWSKVFQAAGVA